MCVPSLARMWSCIRPNNVITFFISLSSQETTLTHSRCICSPLSLWRSRATTRGARLHQLRAPFTRPASHPHTTITATEDSVNATGYDHTLTRSACGGWWRHTHLPRFLLSGCRSQPLHVSLCSGCLRVWALAWGARTSTPAAVGWLGCAAQDRATQTRPATGPRRSVKCADSAITSPLVQIGAKPGFEMCFASAPTDAGVPTKTRLESRMKTLALSML